MNAFHEQSFQGRFAAMGDEAEGIFDLLNPKSHQLGLNRPPFSMRNLTTAMRYVPDRMTGHHFTEVVGVGRDQTLKLKVEKMEALGLWHHIGPVHLFVWDSKNRRYWDEPYSDWLIAINAYGEDGEFHEGKKFRALHTDRFPGTPQALEPAA